MATKAKNVPDWKKSEVEIIKKLLSEYKTIGVVNLQSLPAKQYQDISRKLKDRLTIKYSKKTLFIKAIDTLNSEPLSKLKDHLIGIPALILTNLDAFEMCQLLRKNQSPAAAKAGQLAPEDIWIKAGPTPFAPGPAIAEFGQLKVPAGVESGKIAVKKDTLVVAKGKEFSPLAASMISRLGMKPMKLGIKLVVALDGGEVYAADSLAIDIEQFISNIKTAHIEAMTVAVEAGITTPETIKLLIVKAANEIKALAERANISDASEVHSETSQVTGDKER